MLPFVEMWCSCNAAQSSHGLWGPLQFGHWSQIRCRISAYPEAGTANVTCWRLAADSKGTQANWDNSNLGEKFALCSGVEDWHLSPDHKMRVIQEEIEETSRGKLSLKVDEQLQESFTVVQTRLINFTCNEENHGSESVRARNHQWEPGIIPLFQKSQSKLPSEGMESRMTRNFWMWFFRNDLSNSRRWRLSASSFASCFLVRAQNFLYFGFSLNISSLRAWNIKRICFVQSKHENL